MSQTKIHDNLNTKRRQVPTNQPDFDKSKSKSKPNNPNGIQIKPN